MLTALRKSVLVNYSKIFDNDSKTAVRTKNGEIVLLNHDQVIYEKIKELVLRPSYSYSESMTKIVAHTITKEPKLMKHNLNI